MAIKKVVMIGNQELRKKSDEVSFSNDDISQYIKDLKDTLNHLQSIKNIGRAIAGPQIGCMKRIIYMESSDRRIVMINPEIVMKSHDTFEVWDSCFSADVAFFCKTIRNKTIEVNYFNENGEEIREIFSGDLSELFQHEIDHLNGVLFTDHTLDNQIIMRSEWEKL